MVLVKTSSVGGDGGEPFEENNAGALLIGLSVTPTKLHGQPVVGSLEAIYQSGGNQATGKLRGGRVFQHARVALLAKPGYAVAGIKAAGSDCLERFCIVFMRVKGKKLDPTDSYESDWFGGAEKSEGTRLGCDGNAVAGIFGRAGNVINAIGLIQRLPGQRPPVSRAAWP